MTVPEAIKRISLFINTKNELYQFLIERDGKDIILDANREQMFEGKRSDGSMIDPEYTPITKDIKKQKGQPDDRVTLKDTGDFYDAMFTQKENNETFIISSDDEKTQKLLEKYDVKGTLFGVPDTKKEGVRTKLMSKLRDYFRMYTNF